MQGAGCGFRIQDPNPKFGLAVVSKRPQRTIANRYPFATPMYACVCVCLPVVDLWRIRNSGFGFRVQDSQDTMIRDSSFSNPMIQNQDSGFGIQNSGFKIRDSEFKIQEDSGFRIQDSGSRVQIQDSEVWIRIQD